MRWDLTENQGRHISRSYIKDISDSVGQIVLKKAEKWNYQPAAPPESVKAVGSGSGDAHAYVGRRVASGNGWNHRFLRRRRQPFRYNLFISGPLAW